MSWRVGSREQLREASARSRSLANVAYLAACLAVASRLKETPPTGPGAAKGGRRHTPQETRLRKLAVYTAVCGFDVFAIHVAPYAGVQRRAVSAWVQEVEGWRDDPGGDDLLDELIALARVHVDRRAAA